MARLAIQKIRENFTNETEKYRFGDSEWYEPFTDNRSRLFRSYQKQFGKCKSKVYCDVLMGDGTQRAIQIGWYFEKLVKYEDCNETFLRGVWVEYQGIMKGE